MGKWCLHASSFIFDRIIIKVAGNQDRHKSSDEFDFRPLISMAHLYVVFYLNEIWPWHIGLRWAIVALWVICCCETDRVLCRGDPLSIPIFKSPRACLVLLMFGDLRPTYGKIISSLKKNNNNALFTLVVIHNNVAVSMSSNKCPQMWSNDLYKKS